MTEGHAPTPYTAAQIRDACPSGLRIIYVIDTPEKGRTKQVFALDEWSEAGTRLTFSETTEDDKIIGVVQSELRSWEELQHQASSPADQTSIATETITVPAGTYECMRYTVKRTEEGGGESQDVLWFAYEFPGPPIRWIATSGGVKKMEMNLLERKIAADAE